MFYVLCLYTYNILVQSHYFIYEFSVLDGQMNTNGKTMLIYFKFKGNVFLIAKRKST